MRMYDLIMKKKEGEVLTKEEINFIVDGYTNGSIPDYQMSAFLMAVCLKEMNLQDNIYYSSLCRWPCQRLSHIQVM